MGDKTKGCLVMNMKKLIHLFICTLIPLAVNAAAHAEMHLHQFTGVVTMHLIPAKVIKINKIIENPKPGTSYIGEESILVEVKENPDVMANWTVVTIKYFEYPDPQTIKYKILSEQYTVTVKYHAKGLEIIGDLSNYLKGQ